MSAPEIIPPLVDFSRNLNKPWLKQLYRLFGPVVERVLAIDYVNASHRYVAEAGPERNFFLESLAALDVTYEVAEQDLERIPTEGPVMVLSNHPYGGIDGVVLGALLLSVRDDVKLMANYLLGRMPEIQPWLLPIDPFEGEASARRNLGTLKETLRLLRDGGCVGTFPSGTVSHFQWSQRQISDPDWHVNTARLIRHAKATVVPVYFEGNNGPVFQMAGLINPRLRTLLLPREMRSMRGSVISVRIGNPIPPRKLVDFSTDEAMLSYLRLNTYLLKDRQRSPARRRFKFPIVSRRPKTVWEPLASPVDPALLEAEFEAIPENDFLIRGPQYSVFMVKAQQIPDMMEEIGRLREYTFRQVKEGTGRAFDLDTFDQYYRHLVMWDAKAKAIVGAYRIGLTDEILENYGRHGLYTATLFKFKPGFFMRLNPAMEMGRSFIAPEYQRTPAALGLVWKGIGNFVVRNPQYKTLFGPVSINPEYSKISRDLIIQYLKKRKNDDELSALVKARRPPRRLRIKGNELKAMLAGVRDIEDISALVSEIESDHKGVPVLLRHYLRMNGNLLSFNIDPDFGQCLDGLIVVDLTRSEHKLLRVYLGVEGARSFLRYHGVPFDF